MVRRPRAPRPAPPSLAPVHAPRSCPDANLTTPTTVSPTPPVVITAAANKPGDCNTEVQLQFSAPVGGPGCEATARLARGPEGLWLSGNCQAVGGLGAPAPAQLTLTYTTPQPVVINLIWMSAGTTLTFTAQNGWETTARVVQDPGQWPVYMNPPFPLYPPGGTVNVVASTTDGAFAIRAMHIEALTSPADG